MRGSHATSTYILRTLPSPFHILRRVVHYAPAAVLHWSVLQTQLQMQSLQEKASEWSGVDHADAFAIDETNLFEKLGLQTFVNLSTNFYTRHVLVIRRRSGFLFLISFFVWFCDSFLRFEAIDWNVGFMTMKRNGFDRFSQTRRRKTRFKTNTSFLCREWVGRLCILRGKVNIDLWILFIFSFPWKHLLSTRFASISPLKFESPFKVKYTLLHSISEKVKFEHHIVSVEIT